MGEKESKRKVKMIKYTKFIDNQPIITEHVFNCNEGTAQEIIESCFDFCTGAVKAKVKKFLADDMRLQLTLAFDGFKIKLDKN